MATVEIVIAATVDTPLPAGDTFAGYQFQILDSSNNVVQTGTANAANFTFPNPVPAGTYTASAVAINQANVAMPPAATASFTVPTSATFAAPQTVTVTLS